MRRQWSLLTLRWLSFRGVIGTIPTLLLAYANIACPLAHLVPLLLSSSLPHQVGSLPGVAPRLPHRWHHHKGRAAATAAGGPGWEGSLPTGRYLRLFVFFTVNLQLLLPPGAGPYVMGLRQDCRPLVFQLIRPGNSYKKISSLEVKSPDFLLCYQVP